MNSSMIYLAAVLALLPLVGYTQKHAPITGKNSLEMLTYPAQNENWLDFREEVSISPDNSSKNTRKNLAYQISIKWCWSKSRKIIWE